MTLATNRSCGDASPSQPAFIASKALSIEFVLSRWSHPISIQANVAQTDRQSTLEGFGKAGSAFDLVVQTS